MIERILNLLGLGQATSTDAALVIENQMLKSALATLQDIVAELQNENNKYKAQLSKMAEEDEVLRKRLIDELDVLLLQQTTTIGEA